MWSLFRRQSQPAQRVRRTIPSYRPRVRSLEDRCLLSAGMLDPTFGSGGMVTTAIGSAGSGVAAVVVQPDGKIVAGGVSNASKGGSEFTLARYNADGSLDSSFGQGGVVQTQVGASSSHIGGLSLETVNNQLKIVAVGGAAVKYQGSVVSAWAVVRYNANGTLDTSFNTTGIVLIRAVPKNSIGSAGANAVALDSNGNIEVAGVYGLGTVTDFTVMRFLPSGALDTSFGPSRSGIATTQIGNYASLANALAVQSDGKIVVTGYSNTPGTVHFAMVRYTAAGQLDSSFGTSGVVTNASGLLAGYAVQTLSTGQIVVGGYSPDTTQTGTPDQLTVARFTSAGQLDTSFGQGGLAVDNSLQYALGVVLAANGDILATDSTAAVYGSNGQLIQPCEPAVVAFLPNGALDTAFGNGGMTTANFPSGVDVTGTKALALAPDGDIVVGSMSLANPQGAFALARFLPSEPQIGSFTASQSAAGAAATLTASNITDGNPNSTITQVTFFYYDSNGNKVVLGTVSAPDGSGNWTLSVTLSPGNYTVYAQAQDNYGVWSEPFANPFTVQ